MRAVPVVALAAAVGLAGCGDCEPNHPEPPSTEPVAIRAPFEIAGHTYTAGTVTVAARTVQLEATDADGNVWRVSWERRDAP